MAKAMKKVTRGGVKKGEMVVIAATKKGGKTSVKKPVKKPAKKKAQSQRDYILLDRSGSMRSLWTEAVGSINTYGKGLKDQKVNTKITAWAFSNDGGRLTMQVMRDKVAVKDWTDIGDKEIVPNGMTPLYDAVGAMVAVAKADNPDKAAIIIMTDGFNNASQEFDRVKANALLDECRAKGWQVIFLGANFDNAEQAKSLGASNQQFAKATKGKLGNAMAFAASSRADYATRGVSMSYTDSQKKFLSS